MSDNPYRWNALAPSLHHFFRRPELKRVVDTLRRRGVLVVYAGRGMGKSVLLGQAQEDLQDLDQPVFVVTDAGAPTLAEGIVKALGQPGRDLASALRESVEAGGGCLFIDECDQWLRESHREASIQTLNQLASMLQRELFGKIGVVVAGGVSPLLAFQNPYGSPFGSRVDATVFLRPVELALLREWSLPLRARHATVDEDWLQQLMIATGGIPLLLAVLLGAAWDSDPTGAPHTDPVGTLARWLKSQGGFGAAARSSVQAPEQHSDAVGLLALVEEHPAGLPQRVVEEACGGIAQTEVLVELLVSAGLLSPDADTAADPWLLRRQPSLLRIGPPVRRAPTALEALTRRPRS